MTRPRLLAHFAVLALAALVASGASAQTAQVQVARGPHYMGEAVRVRVSAHGFEEAPAPEVRAPEIEDGRLDLVSASPNVRESISIVNGAVTRVREVTHVYDYHFLPAGPGAVSVGPFTVSQGSLSTTAPAVRLDVRSVPGSTDLDVALALPEGPVYVGERAPVEIVFHIARTLERNLQGYALHVPLFDQTGSFHLLDLEGDAPQGEEITEVVVETAAGRLRLRGRASQVVRNGQPHLRVSVKRMLVPLQAGSVEIPASALLVDEGTAYRRDLFGGRTATRVRKWRASDRPRALDVRPVPMEGRPPSFAGAVGRGFTLEVSAGRTVVKVGDPITLSLRLRGEGIESASLPPLDAEGLLPPERFRVPEGDLAGAIEDGTKHFTAVVRVLDPEVREIPALEFAWFDPQRAAFEVTRSRPVALSVGDAEVIGAADVERATPRPGSQSPDDPDAPGPATGPGTFALTGADLAIEEDPSRLLVAEGSAPGGPWLSLGLYLGSLLLVGGAFLDQRRRDVDPELAARRRRLVAGAREVAAAVKAAQPDAVDAVAAALRRMRAALPAHRDPDLEDFLGECDERRYAPAGAAAALPGDFAERAERLAARMLEAGG